MTGEECLGGDRGGPSFGSGPFETKPSVTEVEDYHEGTEPLGVLTDKKDLM